MTAPIADIPALNAKAAEYIQEAKAILQNPDASTEDKGKVQHLMNEAKRLQGEAIQMDHLLQIENALKAAGANSAHANTDTEKGIDPFDVKYLPDGSAYKTVEGYVRAIVAATPTPVNPTPKPAKGLVWFDDSKDVQSLSGAQRKDMVESVGASGGFLVPPEAFTNVLAVQQQLMSVIRARATIIRMRRRQIQIPVLDQTSTTTGRPHWFGGLRAYWTEEAGQKTQSDAAWRQITLVAHKLAAYARVSDELIDDAVISLTDFLMGPMGFPGVIAWMEEDAFWNGTGAGQPQGILNAPATITYSREDQNNITYADCL
ncbi:MAG: phage major capsid protein, partial [Acidobacteria bacterium]|nr:phage major capsid protein [Acidobacteriota bacterium]